MAEADQFTRLRMVWLDQVWDDVRLNSPARDVAFRISRLFNRRHFAASGELNAWPSYETLAREIDCNAKTIQRAVLLLKQHGHLVTEGSGGRHCSLSYFAVIKSAKSTMEVDGGKQSKIVKKGGHICPSIEGKEAEKVDIFVQKGGHICPEKVDKNVLQISMNKSMSKPMSVNNRNSSFSKTRKNQKSGKYEPASWAQMIDEEVQL